MVERAHGLDAVIAQFLDFEFFAQQIQVQQGPDVFLFLGVAQGFGVEPADKELKGEVVGVGEAEGLIALVFGVEDVAEEWGVGAEELFVEDPVGVVGADVDVYEGVGEESIGGGG